MAQQTELEITRREVMGKATKRLRKAGIIPANIFGHKEASLPVQIEGAAFDRLRRSHGTRSIIALRIPGATTTQTALIRHMQHDPRSGKIIHIDFFRVSLRERINVKIPLHFIGESLAVKNENGVLLHLLDMLEVECIASDIPEYLEVEITPLNEIDAVLHAEDVKLPANFTLITDAQEPIAKVAAPRIEKEEAAPEADEAPAAAEAATGQTSTEG